MQNNKLPSIIILMILSLITVIIWVALTIYRVFTTKPTPIVSQEIVQDINPRLDITTLDQIEQKAYP